MPINDLKIDLKKLTERAAHQGMSGRQIGRAAGISSGGIAKILNGDTDPSATRLKRICEVLDISIEEVFVSKKAS